MGDEIIKKECPFCSRSKSNEVLVESELAIAFYDKYPVNLGHTLIIPRRHCASYFDLTLIEQNECWKLVAETKMMIEELYKPNGFNIGINVGKAAGQTIFHVHIHLIPRYENDVPSPEGGVRGVIPNKMKY